MNFSIVGEACLRTKGDTPLDRFLLKIDPPQPCQGSYPDGQGGEGHCTLLTGMAEASYDHSMGWAPQLSVNPYCWRHLYIAYPDPTPEELELEHFCITNFVVNHFGGEGRAEVLGVCPTDSIPPPYEPWDPDEDMDDDAWYVTYHAPDSREHRGVAIYLVWENWFEWHEFPASIQPQQ